MKKQIISSAIVMLLLACSLISCTKGDNELIPEQPESPVDYLPSFTNTTWVGEFHLRNASVQPFTAFFKSNGELIWRDVTGDITGGWTLEGAEVSIYLRGSKAFKASITFDNTLFNIINTDIDGRILDNAGLDNSPEPFLNHTTWTYPNFSVTFLPGEFAQVVIGVSQYIVSYTREGKAIRFNPYYGWRYFMVAGPANTMKGVNWFITDTVVYPFVATKK